LPEDAVVLVSPARRARETALALKRKFTVSESLDTGADARDLLAAAGWPREAQEPHTTVIVGHQPTLGHAASLLLTGAEGELSFRKGAVWWISTRMRSGRPQATLCAAMTPELLRKAT
jgi:phosphohistidine phosphatase